MSEVLEALPVFCCYAKAENIPRKTGRSSKDARLRPGGRCLCAPRAAAPRGPCRRAAITDVPVALQLLQRRALLAEAVLGGRGGGPGGAGRQELLERAGGRAGGAAAAHPVHRRRRPAAQAALHLPQPPEGLQEPRRLGAPSAAGPRHPRGLRATRS